MNKIVGIDLGYANTKVYDGSPHIFPSIVGTPEDASFQAMGRGVAFQITYDGKKYNVGDSALEQSRLSYRQEDRDWYKSNDYMVLFMAALSKAFNHSGEAQVVTGLPINFYENDKSELEARLTAIHHIMQPNKETVSVNVSRCRVIPQPMGTLIDAGLDENGTIVNAEVATSHIGVIDIGGKTTNLLHANKMSDVRPESASVEIGGWDIVRAARPAIENVARGAKLDDHDIATAIRTRSVSYRGEMLELDGALDDSLNDFAMAIASKAKEFWPGQGAELNNIFLSGGGAQLIGDLVKRHIEHPNITIVDDSVFANVRGYYKLGKLKEAHAA
jgi:plasmid segregation protein ParM